MPSVKLCFCLLINITRVSRFPAPTNPLPLASLLAPLPPTYLALGVAIESETLFPFDCQWSHRLVGRSGLFGGQRTS